jgi:hypothetical protein
MPEEQPEKLDKTSVPRDPGGRRRGRRGGRGRRRPAPVSPVSGQPAQVESTAEQIEPPIRLREEMPVRPAPSKQKFQPPDSAPVEPPKEKFRPALRKNNPDVPPINQAINEVTEVVESLRQALEQMEEVLELVELAERQKLTDEREIESLLRALRQLQSRGRTERPGRFERPESPPPAD